MAAVADRYGGQSARRRIGSASAVVGLHVIAVMAALSTTAELKDSPRQAIATVNLTDPGPPAPEPVEKPQPREVEPTPPHPIVVPPPAVEIPSLSPMVVSLLEQADAQAAGGCDLTYPIQVALQTSPEVQRELSSIPQSRRSVANAVALWNQTWVEPDQELKEPVLEIIRTTVAMTIAAASEACRAQIQGGPRLIYLPDKGETTVLALGSGEWTWQQVSDSANPTLADNGQALNTNRRLQTGGPFDSIFAAILSE